MADPQATNILLEQALLGSMLLNNDSIDYLPPTFDEGAFAFQEHKQIYAEIKRRNGLGLLATPVALKDTFPPGPTWPGAMTATQYMATLCGRATSALGVSSYALDLQALAGLRALWEIADGAIRSNEFRLAPSVALDDALGRLDELRLRNSAGEESAMLASVAAAIVTQLEATQDGIAQRGVLTGITSLDEALAGGFKPGELIVAGGRPGMGKTTFAVTGCMAGARLGFPSILFSLEMPRAQIGARCLSEWMFDTSSLPYNAMIYTGREMQGQVLEAAREAQREMATTPLVLDTSSKLSIADIGARARRASRQLKAQFGVPLAAIWIDYLHFIKSSDRYRGERHLEIGEITAGLKQLAKDEGWAVILLCQLNRGPEQREDRRPNLSDLRQSGHIEEDADVVLFLYREYYYTRNETMRNELEIIIAKQRMGALSVIPAYCDMGCSAIRDAR